MIQTSNDSVRVALAGIALAIAGILFGRLTAPKAVPEDTKWKTIIDSLQRRDTDLTNKLKVSKIKSDSIATELRRAEKDGSRLQQELNQAKLVRTQRTSKVFELTDTDLVRSFTFEVNKVKQGH